MIETNQFFISAADGYALGATLFTPCTEEVNLDNIPAPSDLALSSPTPDAKALILVAGATGCYLPH